MASSPLELVRSVAKALSPRDPREDVLGHVVYVVNGPADPDDDWASMVLDMANGATVGEIVERMYREEVRAGAWAADIGIWRDLFDGRVIDCIQDLAEGGYLTLG